jgi:hypothetical protein
MSRKAPDQMTAAGGIKRFHDHLLSNEGRLIVRVNGWSLTDLSCRSVCSQCNDRPESGHLWSVVKLNQLVAVISPGRHVLSNQNCLGP